MEIDRISLSDLELFGETGGGGGVASLFCETETDVGRAALHRRLRSPSVDIGEIVRTQAAVRFFRDDWSSRLLAPKAIEGVERYLASNIDLGRRATLRSDLALSLWLPLRDRDLCRELRSGVASFPARCWPRTLRRWFDLSQDVSRLPRASWATSGRRRRCSR
jgi:hypothetical protein